MHKQTKQWMSALLAALMFSSSAFSVDFSAHANEKKRIHPKFNKKKA